MPFFLKLFLPFRHLLFVSLILLFSASCSFFGMGQSQISRSGEDYLNLKQRCEERKDGNACREIGHLERHEDLRLSAFYYREGCKHADARSCDELLRISLFTRQIDHDMKQFHAQCRDRHDFNCSLIGRYYYNHQTDEFERAIEDLERGCRGDDIRSCFMLVDFFQENNRHEDRFKALQMTCLNASERNWSESRHELLLRQSSIHSCLITGLNFFEKQSFEDSAYFYRLGCQLAPISGLGLDSEARMHHLLACSRAFVLSSQSMPQNWLNVSRDYFKTQCEQRIGQDYMGDCYDMAALASIRGELREALRFLKLSIEAGNRNFAHMRTDPELKSLRTLPEFERLINEFKSR